MTHFEFNSLRDSVTVLAIKGSCVIYSIQGHSLAAYNDQGPL